MEHLTTVQKISDIRTHSKWWLTQFERKCNILEIFHYFQYFERFRSMKKWQISKPKIVDWYLDFSNESYTTLKSVISSFKICFQNYGQLKRKCLRPKNTSSTFLKLWPSVWLVTKWKSKIGVVNGVISATESELEESERFHRLRSAYDPVKTRLLESEAEAEG